MCVCVDVCVSIVSTRVCPEEEEEVEEEEEEEVHSSRRSSLPLFLSFSLSCGLGVVSVAMATR